MDPAQDDNLNLDISPSTGDDATWAVIQGWLDTCLRTHQRCNQRPSDAFVPGRLLRLDTAAGPEPEPVFCLVHGSEIEPGTRYVALSHFFGADDVGLGLTASTLAQLSAPQPVSVLLAAFADAMTVVARLGLAHLWVDRLCLLPDELRRRPIQADKVSDVFRNAFLAVAASGSTSPSSGLFHARDPALVAPTVFDLPVSEDGTTIPHRYSLETPHGWMHAFRADPLSRSARAVQERLLARRVVHFGRSMVFWECHVASCAEIHPRGVAEDMDGSGGVAEAETGGETRRRNSPWKALLGAPSGRPRRDPVHQVFADWLDIVEAYSGCAPAAPDQKLPGLAEVTDDMRGQLRRRGCEETRYLSGMWEVMLPGGAGLEHARARQSAGGVPRALMELGRRQRKRQLPRPHARRGRTGAPLRAPRRFRNAPLRRRDRRGREGEHRPQGQARTRDAGPPLRRRSGADQGPGRPGREDGPG